MEVGRMTEENPQIDNESPPTQKIQVEVKGDTKKIQQLERERDELKNTLEELAEKEYEAQKEGLANQFPQHKEAILNIESPSEFEAIKAVLTDEKHAPIGIIHLRDSKTQNVMTRPFDSQSEMLGTLYKASRTDPAMNDALSQLWEKAEKTQSRSFQLQDAISKRRDPHNQYVIMSDLKGSTVYVPLADAKSLSPEILKQRIENGYY